MSEQDPCKADFQRRDRAWRDRGLIEDHGDFQRRINFTPGYDHTAFPEACGGGGHGRHGMEMSFVFVGPHGATQWVVSMPNWLPRSVGPLGNLPLSFPKLEEIYSLDLGYHSPKPLYDDQMAMECELLPGGHCFYDGSGLRAGPVLEKFLWHGPAAVWAELSSYYVELFGGANSEAVS